MYTEENYLNISGIMDYTVCRRRWALHNLEQIWLDNWRTTDGSIMHERAHDNTVAEKRGDKITVNALKIFSAKLGISGECDVVEFISDRNGVYLPKYKNYYIPFPIEYKRGKGASFESDIMQLCAQAMCLEEMLCCEIKFGAVFYGEPHRRFDVEFSSELRLKVEETLKEMHDLNSKSFTPKAKYCKYCNECSLKNICLPIIMEKNINVKEYLQKGFAE